MKEKRTEAGVRARRGHRSRKPGGAFSAEGRELAGELEGVGVHRFRMQGAKFGEVSEQRLEAVDELQQQKVRHRRHPVGPGRIDHLRQGFAPAPQEGGDLADESAETLVGAAVQGRRQKILIEHDGTVGATLPDPGDRQQDEVVDRFALQHETEIRNCHPHVDFGGRAPGAVSQAAIGRQEARVHAPVTVGIDLRQVADTASAGPETPAGSRTGEEPRGASS